ncbi:hypothetical protein [Nonomuraea sp. NPDC050310]|uniref:hypothetical protein n=1 Tax=Nonomuraea sp. NPDC050310 TaxID=3154935 RepID=UPI00340944BC
MKVFVNDPTTGQPVERELRDDEFPCQIGVFCDGCGTATERDYVVSEAMTKPERFEVARITLRRDGWQCDASGDWCTACKVGREQGGEVFAR